jgi:two-component system, CAI-1 autoinducer sensor kinase/phosphatase CqsS
LFISNIASVVKFAINEFVFEDKDQKNLINLNLSDDFEFFDSETLMIYVLFHLLKNSLHYKVKINIWLNSKNKELYFKDEGQGINSDKLYNFSFKNGQYSKIFLFDICKK